MVFTEKLVDVMVTQLEASEMKIPFCCTSKGRLNTDGENMVSGCDFCLIMLPAKKPKWMFGPQIVTNITSTCFLELPDNSTVYIPVDNKQLFLSVSQVFGNLCMDDPGKKKERKHQILYDQTCLLFHCILYCKREKHFVYP